MGADSYSEQVVLRALAGEAEIARGVTFVPADLMAETLRVPSGVHPLIAVAQEMRLDFAFVRESAEDALGTVERLRAVGTAPMWAVDGPFGRVASVRGWAAALADVMRDRAGLAARVMESAGEIAEGLGAAANAGITAVVVAEDIALAAGMLMGPDDALDIIMPGLSLIAESASAVGKPCVLHSDGDARVFFEALSREGFAGVHVGGMGNEVFEWQYTAARDVGLAVIGGLEGVDLRGGTDGAARAAGAARTLGQARGLLAADDGGLTTLEEMRNLVLALRQMNGEA